MYDIIHLFLISQRYHITRTVSIFVIATDGYDRIKRSLYLNR